jgi:hypothetical protein
MYIRTIIHIAVQIGMSGCVWTKINAFYKADFPYSYGGCSGGHLDDGRGRKVACCYTAIPTAKAVFMYEHIEMGDSL